MVAEVAANELLTIGNPAAILTPAHFSRIGREVGTGDVVMNADLHAADAREIAFGLVGASVCIGILH